MQRDIEEKKILRDFVRSDLPKGIEATCYELAKSLILFGNDIDEGSARSKLRENISARTNGTKLKIETEKHNRTDLTVALKNSPEASIYVEIKTAIKNSEKITTKQVKEDIAKLSIRKLKSNNKRCLFLIFGDPGKFKNLGNELSFVEELFNAHQGRSNIDIDFENTNKERAKQTQLKSMNISKMRVAPSRRFILPRFAALSWWVHSPIE